MERRESVETMQKRLLAVAGVLVFVSAAIHLALGVSGLVEALSGGGSALLPALYLLGGLAAIALLGVITLTPVTTTAYAAGAGLMGLFLLAYADVHAFGVVESTLGIEFHDHGDHAHDHNGHGEEHNGHDHNGHDNGHDDHTDDGHDHNGEGHSHDNGHDGHDHNGHDNGDDHNGEGHSHDHNNDHDHSHDGDTMTVLADHLIDDAYALVSKAAETSAAVVFIVLALLER